MSVGDRALATSANGTEWTALATTARLTDVTRGPDQWVAVGRGAILASSLGTGGWAQVATGTATLYGVTCGGGRYLAVGEGSTVYSQPMASAGLA